MALAAAAVGSHGDRNLGAITGFLARLDDQEAVLLSDAFSLGNLLR
jgi:hypothetical protein